MGGRGKFTIEQIRLVCGDPAQSLRTLGTSCVERIVRRHKLVFIEKVLLDSGDIRDRDLWKTMQSMQVKQSLFLSSALVELIREFRTKGVQAFPLKGPVLARKLYGDVARRHSGDLDFLVAEDQLEASSASLTAKGYELVSPDRKLSPLSMTYYLKHKHELAYYNKETGLHVELHTGLKKRAYFDQGDVLLNKEALSRGIFSGEQITELKNEKLFIYLCSHGSYHQYYRIFWLKDIDQALNVLPLDHSRIMESAKILGVGLQVALSLLLSQDIFQTEIPEVYQRFISDHRRRLDILMGLCKERMQGEEVLDFRGKFRRMYFLILVNPGLPAFLRQFSGYFHRWYIRKFLGGH